MEEQIKLHEVLSMIIVALIIFGALYFLYQDTLYRTYYYEERVWIDPCKATLSNYDEFVNRPGNKFSYFIKGYEVVDFSSDYPKLFTDGAISDKEDHIREISIRVNKDCDLTWVWYLGIIMYTLACFAGLDYLVSKYH